MQLFRGVWLGWAKLIANPDDDGYRTELESLVTRRFVLPLGRSWSPNQSVAADFATLCRPYNRNYAQARQRHLTALGLQSIGVVVEIPYAVFSEQELVDAKEEGLRKAARNKQRHGHTFGDEEEYHFSSLVPMWPPESLTLLVVSAAGTAESPSTASLTTESGKFEELDPMAHHNRFIGSYVKPWHARMHSPYLNWNNYCEGRAIGDADGLSDPI
jgi:hypothetical protein